MLFSGNLQHPKIDWVGLRATLGCATGRKLLLFNCSNAATPSIGRFDEVEILCSSPFGTTAPRSIIHDFATRLADILDGSPTPTMTVAGLETKLLSDGLLNGLGKLSWQKSNGSDDSTTLRPCDGKPAALLKLLQPEANMKVLLAVSIAGTDTMSSYDNFIEWLTMNVPEELSDIKIEAAFDGTTSHLFLVTFPIEVWAMLPDDAAAAWYLVGLISSGNRLVERLGTVLPTGAKQIK